LVAPIERNPRCLTPIKPGLSTGKRNPGRKVLLF
jgi:hypothetical protein